MGSSGSIRRAELNWKGGSVSEGSTQLLGSRLETMIGAG